MIKILLLISMVSFGGFVPMNACNKNESVVATTPANTRYAESDSEKFLKISELNEEKPNKGTFKIKGFVAKIYTCPSCPPDAQCKPCMRDNIVVSDENKSLDDYNLTEKEAIIFTDKAKSFAKGKQYQFTIKITDSKTTSANLNDIELIGSDYAAN